MPRRRHAARGPRRSSPRTTGADLVRDRADRPSSRPASVARQRARRRRGGARTARAPTPTASPAPGRRRPSAPCPETPTRSSPSRSAAAAASSPVETALQLRVVAPALDPRGQRELVEQLGELLARRPRSSPSSRRKVGSSPSAAASIVRANPKTVASGVRRSWHARLTSFGEALVLPAHAPLVRLQHRWSARDARYDRSPGLRARGAASACRGPACGASARRSASAAGRTRSSSPPRSPARSTSTPAQSGVHMSRFPELFEQAIDELVIGEALLVEELAEHIARTSSSRQRALRAEVEVDRALPDRARDAGDRACARRRWSR